MCTYIVCSWFLQPQCIRKPGQSSADERELLGLAQRSKGIKHKTSAACVCLHKSYQVSRMSTVNFMHILCLFLFEAFGVCNFFIAQHFHERCCERRKTGYLGKHLRPGDSQQITKLIPVGSYCGEVALPGTDTQHQVSQRGT